MPRKLGRSQEKVLTYIRANPNCTVKQVGKALYDSTSSCATRGSTWGWSREKLATHWASEVVRQLKIKNLVAGAYRDREVTLWVIPPQEETPS